MLSLFLRFVLLYAKICSTKKNNVFGLNVMFVREVSIAFIFFFNSVVQALNVFLLAFSIQFDSTRWQTICPWFLMQIVACMPTSQVWSCCVSCKIICFVISETKCTDFNLKVLHILVHYKRKFQNPAFIFTHSAEDAANDSS